MNFRILAVFCALLIVSVTSESFDSENELKELEATLEKFQPKALEVLEELKKEELLEIPRGCGLKIVERVVGYCGTVEDCKSNYLAPLACRTKLNEKVFQAICCNDN